MVEEKTGATKVTDSRETCAQGGPRAMICDGHRQWDRSQVPAEVPQEWGRKKLYRAASRTRGLGSLSASR